MTQSATSAKKVRREKAKAMSTGNGRGNALPSLLPGKVGEWRWARGTEEERPASQPGPPGLWTSCVKQQEQGKPQEAHEGEEGELGHRG